MLLTGANVIWAICGSSAMGIGVRRDSRGRGNLTVRGKGATMWAMGMKTKGLR